MAALSRQVLLDLWDDGHRMPAQAWANALMRTVRGADDPIDAARPASVGDRDAALLRWRNQVFGRQLLAGSTCPHCAEPVELALDGGAMLQAAVPPAGGQAWTVTHDGGTLDFRLPSPEDIAAMAACASVAEAEALLLARCVDARSADGAPMAASDLPERALDGLSARMSALDPQADVQLRLSCPACAGDWRVAFDVVPFLWDEIDAWARRVLAEVHALACAYAWPEHQILALSSARRRAYLALVRG